MKQRGLIDRYIKRMNIVSGIRCGTATSTTRYRAHLGVNDVATAGYVIFLGFSICLLAFVMEWAWYWNKRRVERYKILNRIKLT